MASSVIYDVDGLVQERRNPIANTLELSFSCTNPSTFSYCYPRRDALNVQFHVEYLKANLDGLVKYQPISTALATNHSIHGKLRISDT